MIFFCFFVVGLKTMLANNKVANIVFNIFSYCQITPLLKVGT